MPRVFISYRREDSAGHVGRLHDDLKRALGAKKVFLDVDSIKLGADFEQTIRRVISKCDVVLAVIGKDWLSVTDEQGRRRLDSNSDYVRLELATALASKTRVIPVLVRNANVPIAQELPPDLSKLVNYNGIKLRDERWKADVNHLLRSIGGLSIVRWIRRHKFKSAYIAFFPLVFVFVWYLTQGPEQSVDRFLTLLAQEKTREAYVSTSSVFKETTNEQMFQEFVERFDIDDNASAFWSERKLQPGRAVLRGTVTTKQRTVIPMTITLVKEGEDWKIVSIDLSEEGNNIE